MLVNRIFLFAGGVVGYGCFRKEIVIVTEGIKGITGMTLWISDWG
jgi:hypothetical protein